MMLGYPSHIVNNQVLTPGMYNTNGGRAPVTENRTGACETIYHIDKYNSRIHPNPANTLYPKSSADSTADDIREGDPIVLMRRGKHSDTTLPPYAATNLMGMGVINHLINEKYKISMAKFLLKQSLVFGGFSVTNVDVKRNETTFNGALSGNMTMAVRNPTEFKVGDPLTLDLPDPPTSMTTKLTMEVKPYQHTDVINDTMELIKTSLVDEDNYKRLCGNNDYLNYRERLVQKILENSKMDFLLGLEMLLQTGIIKFSEDTTDIFTLPQINPSVKPQRAGFKVRDCVGSGNNIEEKVIKLAEKMGIFKTKGSLNTAEEKKFFDDWNRVFLGMTTYDGTLVNFEFGNTNSGFESRDATSNELLQTHNGDFIDNQIKCKRNLLATLSALVHEERRWIVGKVIKVNDNSIDTIIAGNGL